MCTLLDCRWARPRISQTNPTNIPRRIRVLDQSSSYVVAVVLEDDLIGGCALLDEGIWWEISNGDGEENPGGGKMVSGF